MPNELIEQVLKRAETDKDESDFAYFFALLLAGEALTKTVVLGMLAAVDSDKERNRYRLEYSLVRASGLGEWSTAIEDILTGRAAQHLARDAQQEQKALTILCGKDEWQYEAVSGLKSALDALRIDADALPNRTDMKRWFRLFATLRNKTRGHGATRPSQTGEAAMHLQSSIQTIYENFPLFQREWVYLHRNISGKYRVSSLGNATSAFDFLKREPHHNFENGVYVHFEEPQLVPLLESGPELDDFFIANGGFSGKSFDLLSYASDDKQKGDASSYLTTPDPLPASETQGHGELQLRGNCFSNAPIACA